MTRAGRKSRPILIGEFPYYRADPENWPGALVAMCDLGIDVVSMYIPWRLHEVGETANELGFDFTGRTHPQRDVVRFMGLAHDLGMKTLPKPGPYIHAEVQYGGLPDRVMDGFEAYTTATGRHLTSHGRPLPSFRPDTRFVMEARHWLTAVSTQVLQIVPSESLYAVQIGNEGACGEVALGSDRQDIWPANRNGDENITVQAWRWISEALTGDFRRMVNIPLVSLADESNILSSWIDAQEAFRAAGFYQARTEWVGNPAAATDSLISIIIGSMFGASEVAESNWGFTWSDEAYKEDGPAIFASMLSLMLGASSLSYYPAVVTEHWHPAITEDEPGLRLEGLDPTRRRPPYCPGAPIHEDGSHGATYRSATRLARFVHGYGHYFHRTRLTPSGDIVFDPSLASVCRCDPSGSLARAARVIAQRRHPDYGTLVGPIFEPNASPGLTEPAKPAPQVCPSPGQAPHDGIRQPLTIERVDESGSIRIVGSFNSTDQATLARTGHVGSEDAWLAPHCARIVIFQDGHQISAIASANPERSQISAPYLRPIDDNIMPDTKGRGE